MIFLVPPTLWLASWHGPAGIAWVLLLLQTVMFVPAWYFLVRPLCDAKLIEYSIAALKPFMLAVLAVTPAFGIAFQFDGAFVRIVIGLSISAPLYFLLSYLGNRDWIKAMLELAGINAGSTKD